MAGSERLSLVEEAIANRQGKQIARETTAPAGLGEIYTLGNAFKTFTSHHTPWMERLTAEDFSPFRAPDLDTFNIVARETNGDEVNVVIGLEQGVFGSTFEIKVEDVPEFFVFGGFARGVVETRKVISPSGFLAKEKTEITSTRPLEVDDVIRLTGLLEQLDDPATEVSRWRLLGESYIKYAAAG